MTRILLLLSVWILTLGGSSSQRTRRSDTSFYNLWCDPEYEDECYFVEESCDPDSDTDFNCEYHPALFVEDDNDAIKDRYMLWCDPSDQDECYFVDATCDPENDLDTCEYYPAIFVDSDFEQFEKDMIALNEGGRRLGSRYYKHRRHRYRRYRRRPYHRYRRRRYRRYRRGRYGRRGYYGYGYGY